MIKRALIASTIGVVLMAIVSAQGQLGVPAGTPLPSSKLGTLRQPVMVIPKALGKKTPWGDPDLQGMWNSGGTPLQRDQRYGDREYLTDQELADGKAQASDRLIPETSEQARIPSFAVGPTFWNEVTEPSGRTSLIYDPPDGRLPPTTPQYQAQQAERARLLKEPRFDRSIWERQGIWVRCISRGQPAGMTPLGYNNNYQIIQAPGYVVVLQEMIHAARIIPLDGRPQLDPSIRLWEGSPRGRWEGQTLVVESSNFHPDNEPMDRQPTAGGVDYKVVEKFTRVSEADLDYRYRLDAPSVFTRPWSAAIPMTTIAAPARMTEYACQEDNHAVRLTITGLVRQVTDPDYAARVRAEEEAAAARGRRGGGPAGVPEGGRGAGP